MSPGEGLELRLTIRYEGLKATQYFAKFTPDSDKVFRKDLLVLRLPHPKRENMNLLSHGSVECFWISVPRNGILHKQIVTKTQPPDEEDRRILQENLKNLSISKLTLKQIDNRVPPNRPTSKRPNPNDGPAQRAAARVASLAKAAAHTHLPPKPTTSFQAPQQPVISPEDAFRTEMNPYSLMFDNASLQPTTAPAKLLPPLLFKTRQTPTSNQTAVSPPKPGSSSKRPYSAISDVDQGQDSNKRSEWGGSSGGWNSPTLKHAREAEWVVGPPPKIAKTHAGPFELPQRPTSDAAPLAVPPTNGVPLLGFISSLPPASTKLPTGMERAVKTTVDKPPVAPTTQARGPTASGAPASVPKASIRAQVPTAPKAQRMQPAPAPRRQSGVGAAPSAGSPVLAKARAAADMPIVPAPAPVPPQRPAPSSTPTSAIPAVTATPQVRVRVTPRHSGPLPPLAPRAQVQIERMHSATTSTVAQTAPSTPSQSLSVPAPSSPALSSSPIPGLTASTNAAKKVPVVDLGQKRPHIEQADARAKALAMATKAHEPPSAPSAATTSRHQVSVQQPRSSISGPIASGSKPSLAMVSSNPKSQILPANVALPATPASVVPQPMPPPSAAAPQLRMTPPGLSAYPVRVKEEPVDVETLPSPSVGAQHRLSVKQEVAPFLFDASTTKRKRPSRFAPPTEPSPFPTPPPSAESLPSIEATPVLQKRQSLADPSGKPGPETTNLSTVTETVAHSSIVMGVPPSPPISSTSPPADLEVLPPLLHIHSHDHPHENASYQRRHEHHEHAPYDDTTARENRKHTTSSYGSSKKLNHRRGSGDTATRIQSLTRESWSIKRELTASLEREKELIRDLQSLGSAWIPEPTRMWEKKDEGRLLDLRARLETAEQELEEKGRAQVAEERERSAAAHRELTEAARRMKELEWQLKEERERRKVADDAIQDIRRECREPFVVPSLVDAFLQISTLTSRAIKAAEEKRGAELGGASTGAAGAMTDVDVQEVLGATVLATALTATTETAPTIRGERELFAEDMDLSDP